MKKLNKIITLMTINSLFLSNIAWAGAMDLTLNKQAHCLSPVLSSISAGFQNAFSNILEKNEYFMDISNVDMLNKIGAKARSFSLFNSLSLQYPEGVVIHPEAVERILNGDEHFLNTLVEKLIKQFPEYNASVTKNIRNYDVVKRLLSVRSAPVKSMPGILGTVLNVGSTYLNDYQIKPSNFLNSLKENELKNFAELLDDKEYEGEFNSLEDELKNAIKAVAFTWKKQKAKKHRKERGISDKETPAILVQKMVFGNLNTNSATGVAFSRDPNTAEKKLSGSFLLKSQGVALVSGQKQGISLEKLQNKFPEAYRILQEKIQLLEAITGFPQEVEFTIQDGEIYFLQARDICFAPHIEIKYLEQAIAEGKISSMNALPRITSLQEKTSFRQVFRVKKNVKKRILGKGLTSTPGAMYGECVFDIAQAKQLNKQGKGAILIITKKNRNIFSEIFDLPNIGIITTYGDISSHEAVLTRFAGIPSIVNIDEQILIKLKKGMMIGADGDNNNIFTTEAKDILEVDTSVADASFGIDISSFEKEYLRKILSIPAHDFPSKKEILNKLVNFSLGRMHVLHEIHKINWRRLEKEENLNEAFISNIKQHVWHKLILIKEESLGVKNTTFKGYVKQVDLWLLSICAQLSEQDVEIDEGIIDCLIKIVEAKANRYENPNKNEYIAGKVKCDIRFLREEVIVKVLRSIEENIDRMVRIQRRKRFLKSRNEPESFELVRGKFKFSEEDRMRILEAGNHFDLQAIEGFENGSTSAGPFEFSGPNPRYPGVYDTYRYNYVFTGSSVLIDRFHREEHFQMHSDRRLIVVELSKDYLIKKCILKPKKEMGDKPKIKLKKKKNKEDKTNYKSIASRENLNSSIPRKKDSQKISNVQTLNKRILLTVDDQNIIRSELRKLDLSKFVNQVFQMVKNEGRIGPFEWEEKNPKYEGVVDRYTVSFIYHDGVIEVKYFHLEKHNDSHVIADEQRRIVLPDIARRFSETASRSNPNSLDSRLFGKKLEIKIGNSNIYKATVPSKDISYIEVDLEILRRGTPESIGEDSEGEDVDIIKIEYRIKRKSISEINFSVTRYICALVRNLNPIKKSYRAWYGTDVMVDVVEPVIFAATPLSAATTEEKIWISRFENIKDDKVLCYCLENATYIIQNCVSDEQWFRFLLQIESKFEDKSPVSLKTDKGVEISMEKFLKRSI